MKKIVFVTSNKGKMNTAKKYFDEYGIELSCYEFEIDEPKIDDIELIARAKVKQAYDKVGVPCISVDAGFFIDGYPNNPNFPGAFPKREIIEKMGVEGLLERMKGVENRTCRFKECLAYYDGSDYKIFWGINDGTLSKEIRGMQDEKIWSELWNVFIPKNCNKTLGEMTNEERFSRPDERTDCFEEFIKAMCN